MARTKATTVTEIKTISPGVIEQIYSAQFIFEQSSNQGAEYIAIFAPAKMSEIYILSAIIEPEAISF